MQESGKKFMATHRVPLCKPDIGKEELRVLAEIFEQGSVSHGPQVSELEAVFTKRIGAQHAIAVNSCTSGLFLLCSYIREHFGAGEIIVPSFTFVASANSIVCVGMTPRFVDVDWNTAEVTADLIEPAINKNTKAIMVVHYAGRPCAMTEIMDLAARHDLPVIEDSAECLGARVNGKEAGSFGWGVFSFYGTKNITTGEGGMITFNDDDLGKWLRLRVAHGVSKRSYSRYNIARRWYRNAIVAGYNFRLSNLQAAIGLVQMKKLDKMNKHRYDIAKKYYDSLSNIPGLKCAELLTDHEHSYQMYPIRVPEKVRDSMLLYLNEQGVGASVHFDPPVHWQSAYIDKRVILPVTERLARSTITLPISSVQTDAETDYVIYRIKEALNR